MSNNAPDYEDNLFFEPKEIEQKLAHSEKMRDYTAEYVAKLEEKLRMADNVISDVELWFSGMVGTLNNECAEHNKSVPVGNFENVFKVYADSLSDLRKRIKE